MFKDALRDVVERTEGSIAGLLMGFDGIPVEHYLRDGVTLDVEGIGMEYSVVLPHISAAAEQLDVGSAREISIQAERQTMLIRMVNDEYFVAVTLEPHGNLGKARYLLRMLTPKLLEELV